MKNKILENWKAIEEIEAKVKEKTGDPQAGFNASTFWFGGDGRHLMIPCMYRGKKGKKGQEEFTNSYKELMVYATFCPFTGAPLYEDSVSIADQEKLNLESRIKELEEQKTTEIDVFYNDGIEIFECLSCGMLFEENEPYNNFCPNCGRKIVR